MRQVWVVIALVLLATAAAAAQEVQPPAQQTQNQAPLMGRGRGGAPFAWNDQNRDGTCDLTGQPVGQRPVGYGRGRGWRMMADQPAAATAGRGRGGAPLAWNDRNADGICDLTGKPVGSVGAAGRGAGQGRGGGWRWRR
ncbi:MAG: hypothetical protein R6V57_11680 [Vicinamibacterales bacterium]